MKNASPVSTAASSANAVELSNANQSSEAINENAELKARVKMLEAENARLRRALPDEDVERPIREKVEKGLTRAQAIKVIRQQRDFTKLFELHFPAGVNAHR